MPTTVESVVRKGLRANLRRFDSKVVASETGDDPSPRRLARTARLQLVLTEEAVATLEALKEATGAASFAEVVRRALRIYEGLLAEADDGASILVKRKDGSVENVPLHRAL